MTYKVKSGKLTKPSMHLYFESHPSDPNMCVYGQTMLDFTPKSKSEAYNHIKKNRVSTGMGKWKRALLNTGAVKLHATLDITKFAKLSKLFHKKKKVDDHLVMLVTTDDERSSDGGEYVYISPEELFNRINEFVSIYTGEELEQEDFKPSLIKPRCKLHNKDIQQFKKDFHNFLRNNNLNPENLDKLQYSKLSGHFLQVWACGSGKSTTPMLVYMECFENLYNYKLDNPINLVTNPTIKVLKGNLIKQAAHDLARGAKSKHIVFTSGISSTDDPRTLTELESLGIEVIRDRSTFKEVIEKYKDHTIWIYTTYHSYYNRDKHGDEKKNCLTYLMRSINRSFYFAYIDEYHKTLQGNRQPWSAVHYDDICQIQFRFKCSASKPEFRGKNRSKYQQIFHIGEHNDVIFNPLTIKESVDRGYTREYKVLDFLINKFILSTLQSKEHNLIEVIEDKKHPFVAVTDNKGNKIVAHHSYYWHIVCYLYTIFSGLPIKYTLATCNSVANANKYRDFFIAVRPILVNSMCKGNKKHPMYNTLMNIHVDVMDTKEEANSVKIFERIDEIPTKYSHALIIHCYVAETGWNPGDTLQYKNKKVWKKQQGFINCVTFIDPINSMARIQQNAGRGARAPHISKTCYLLLHHLIDFSEDPNPYNTRFKRTRLATDALEIGEEELHDNITFFDFTKMYVAPAGGKNKGSKYPDFMFEVGNITGVDDKWLKFRESNDYYTPLFDWLERMCLRRIELEKYYRTYLNKANGSKVEAALRKEFPEFFEMWKSKFNYWHMTKGKGYSMSYLTDDALDLIHAYWTTENQETLRNNDIKEITQILNTHFSNMLYPRYHCHSFRPVINSKFGFSGRHQIRHYTQDTFSYWLSNSTHWDNQLKKAYLFIYKLVISNKNHIGNLNEYIFKNFEKSGISSYGINETSIKGLVYNIQYKNVLDKDKTKKFIKAVELIRKNNASANTKIQHANDDRRLQKLLAMNAARKGQKRNKPITFNGIVYSSCAEAARVLGMDKRTIQKKGDFL